MITGAHSATDVSPRQPMSVGDDPPQPAGAHRPLSIVVWLWIGVAVVPMAMVACGAVVAAINERWVGGVINGAMLLWRGIALGAVASSGAQAIRWIRACRVRSR